MTKLVVKAQSSDPNETIATASVRNVGKRGASRLM